MISDFIDEVRDWDRLVADSMELVLANIDDEIPQGIDYPLDERESQLFQVAMTFGALVDRRDTRETDVMDSLGDQNDGHVLSRETVMIEEQVVQPAPNGFAILDVKSREENSTFGYTCTCGEKDMDDIEARRHINDNSE